MTMHTNATTPDPSRTDPDRDPSDRNDGIPERAEPLAAYLDRRLHEEGAFYEKSRFIAEEINLSPKEIGAYMPRLQEEAPALDIEKWAYTNGTTWRVSRP
jgi:hypothetical protein